MSGIRKTAQRVVDEGRRLLGIMGYCRCKGCVTGKPREAVQARVDLATFVLRVTAPEMRERIADAIQKRMDGVPTRIATTSSPTSWTC